MRQFTPAVVGRKMRFALVGCGRIAQNHFAALAQHAERCQLVAVCDVDAAALARAADGEAALRRLGGHAMATGAGATVATAATAATAATVTPVVPVAVAAS